MMRGKQCRTAQNWSQCCGEKYGLKGYYTAREILGFYASTSFDTAPPSAPAVRTLTEPALMSTPDEKI